MPAWLIVIVVVAVLIIALVVRVRRPTEVQRLSKEVAVLMEEGRLAEALPVAERAVEAAREELEKWAHDLGSDHSNLIVTGQLAGAHRVLGRLHLRLENEGQAESAFKRAVDVLENAITENDPLHQSEEPAPPHPDLPEVLGEFALFYSQRSRFQEAISTYRRALELESHIYGEDSPALAGTLINLAGCLDHSGRVEEAEETLLRAISLLEPVASDEELLAFHLVAALNNLGLMYERHSQLEKARTNLQRALVEAGRYLGDNHQPFVEMIQGKLNEIGGSETGGMKS